MALEKKLGVDMGSPRAKFLGRAAAEIALMTPGLTLITPDVMRQIELSRMRAKQAQWRDAAEPKWREYLREREREREQG